MQYFPYYYLTENGAAFEYKIELSIKIFFIFKGKEINP